MQKKGLAVLVALIVVVVLINFASASLISYSSNIKEQTALSNYSSYNIVSQGSAQYLSFSSDKTYNASEDSEGYIVEFKSPPLIEQNKEQGLAMASQSSRSKLEDEHNKAIEDIFEKVQEANIMASPPSESLFSRVWYGISVFFKKTFSKKVLASPPEVKREFYNVFNGISVNIDEREAEFVRQSDYVKAVYPNRKVYANLMDSVPLINADDVWNMQDASGRPITGENITIAVIDTGVDYTHADLGGCLGENCKVIGGYDFVNNDNDPIDDMGHGTHVAATAAGGNFSASAASCGDGICNSEGNKNVHINVGAGEQVIVFGESYTIGLFGITDDAIPRATIIVDTANAVFTEGQTKIVGGISVYAKTIFKSADSEYVELGVEVEDENSCGADCGAGGGGGGNSAGLTAGLKGVAPNAKILAYKVLDAGGSGSFEEVMAGIEQAVIDGADVISMSLGANCRTYSEFCGPDDPQSRAIDAAVNAGVVAVISAGNCGPGGSMWCPKLGDETIGSPGTARKAITIAASSKEDYIASFSSRGNIIWETGAIIKPDVAAPGVDICAAQYDSAWDAYKCYDDKHIAISGTSMAAPHVAGTVALIKQQHPDWTPEEIKMALRSTALDLGYRMQDQGYGRIDALNAVNLTHKPCIARIDTNGKLSGIVNISGEASCDNFKNYTLSFLDGPLINSSNNAIVNGRLGEINSEDLSSGNLFVRLTVNNIYGEHYDDTALLVIDNFNISSIGKLGFIKGIETVKGKIDLSSYQAYKVEYTQTGIIPENWIQVCFNTTRLYGDTLCTFDASSIQNGVYAFRLSVLRNGNWLTSLPYKVGVLRELMDGWPVEINGWPEGASVVADVNNDNKNEIVLPASRYCQGNWCGGGLMYAIFNVSGSNKTILKFMQTGIEKNLLIDYYPSIYYDKETGKNSMGFAADWGGSEIGLVDSDGNYTASWPATLPEGYSPSYPLTIASINNETRDNLFFTGFNDFDNLSIFDYDKFGNLARQTEV